MGRKIIGVPGYKPGDGFGVGLNHLEFLSKFGDPVIIMPHEEFRQVDMLYLTGGADLNPKSYGEIPGFKTSNTDVYKQFFFEERLKNYVNKKIPIFGVCLGFQMLNVYFGGKLQQNSLYHPQSKDRYKPGHKVTILKTGEEVEVNSHHHQLVTQEILSTQLQALATFECNGDGTVIEAFKHNVLPIYAVQWHPEEFYDNFSMNIMNDLITRNKK